MQNQSGVIRDAAAAVIAAVAGAVARAAMHASYR